VVTLVAQWLGGSEARRARALSLTFPWGHLKLSSGQTDGTGDGRGSPEKGWRIELILESYRYRAEDRYANSHEGRGNNPEEGRGERDG
jgi:hypothetical protein